MRNLPVLLAFIRNTVQTVRVFLENQIFRKIERRSEGGFNWGRNHFQKKTSESQGLPQAWFCAEIPYPGWDELAHTHSVPNTQPKTANFSQNLFTYSVRFKLAERILITCKILGGIIQAENYFSGELERFYGSSFLQCKLIF